MDKPKIVVTRGKDGHIWFCPRCRWVCPGVDLDTLLIRFVEHSCSEHEPVAELMRVYRMDRVCAA